MMYICTGTLFSQNNLKRMIKKIIDLPRVIQAKLCFPSQETPLLTNLLRIH